MRASTKHMEGFNMTNITPIDTKKALNLKEESTNNITYEQWREKFCIVASKGQFYSIEDEIFRDLKTWRIENAEYFDTFETELKNGKTKEVSHQWLDKWLKDPNKIKCSDVDFLPNKEWIVRIVKPCL